MAHHSVKRLFQGAWPVAALLILLLIALHLMSNAVQNAEDLSRLFVPLLLFILFGLVALVVLVVVNVVQLVSSYRRQAAGSRFTLRMVVLFVVLALVPVSVVYFYSQQFLLHGIDSWFDVEIDSAMEDALGLSRASLDLHRRERLRSTQKALSRLNEVSVAGLTLSLEEERERLGASEMVIMKPSGQAITSSSADPANLVPELPDSSILQQVREGGSFVGLVPRGEGALLEVRVVVGDPIRPFILQALYPTTESVSVLTEKVQKAYTHYKELAFLRDSLKNTFTLTLALVLLFSLLSAIWAAFFTSQRLVAPVIEIAEGTKAVADGDYDKQLPMPRTQDELSFLVSSFNAMTRRIAQSRDSAQQSQRQVEAQRAYLETVLSHLSSGVMTFDLEGKLRTVNAAACDILGIEPATFLGEAFTALGQKTPHLERFVELLELPLSGAVEEWSEEVTLYGGEGRQILLCRGTSLRKPEGGHTGYVLVFDEITELIRAQRDAAWGEVARRLAHEIKNPLTPIQLSAERLRRKYLHTMDSADAKVLDRSTHTIVQQVEAMKEMVNAFSDYARPPKMNPQPIDVDEFMSEVLDLYSAAGTGPKLSLTLDSDQARVEGDPVRLRQVLHNLIKNAQEAAAERSDGKVEVTTSQREKSECKFVEIRVSDNGPGFDDDPAHLFEPYVTTKAKGTGLGLAIVKKIIEEHGGMIWAENNSAGGASVFIRLPILGDDVSKGPVCSTLPGPVERSAG
jgi:PAS domain S-box-containing protein